MDAAQNGAIVECVEKMVKSLDAVGSALRKRKDEGGDGSVQAAIKTVEENAKLLHSMVVNASSQRVLILSADRMMEAGIVLYNAARAAFKSYQSTLQDGEPHDTSGARFPLLFVRFMAARVMGLALACSKRGGKDLTGDSARDQSVFIDDCLDVLRSYGRVGSLLMETAAADSDKCFEYLILAKEALDYASTIWGQVGLSCLTRFKDGIELEEVLQDVWDFCVDRIRTVRLLQSYTHDSMAVTILIETLHELQMLLPYMMSNTSCLLELIQDALDEWSRSESHVDLVTLAEEALRLCDAVETAQDIGGEESCVVAYKLSFLGRLLGSLVSLGEVEKAETCFALLGHNKDSATLLKMAKLYISTQDHDKASLMLKYLFQRDDVVASLAGARMFVEANAFSDESIQIYRQLERHYGDHVLDIGLELASALAVSDSAQNRARAIAELKRISEMIAAWPRDNQGQVKGQVTRMRQTIHDAAGAALNNNAHDECAAWAELGIHQATSPQEAAVFKRIVAAACLKLNRQSDSRRWAQEAFEMDSSKASMLSVFEAYLGDDDANSSSAADLLRQLRERDDFDAKDLVSYGYAANCAGREDLTLAIMDDLCGVLSDGSTVIEELPLGQLLQNTAQLALRAVTSRSDGAPETPTSYASHLEKYTDMFFNAACRLSTTAVERFASEATFVWFYTMSFNVARSCNHSFLFVRAADVAKEARRFFGEKCVISGRELECLLAALSSKMVNLDSIGRDSLSGILDVVERIKPLCGPASDYNDFLVKSELATRLRMCDSDVELMKKLCQEKMQKGVSNCIDIGELILQASKFDEANMVRRQYRGLARDMFKRSMQLLLQGDDIDQGNLSYLFRRLITLAESRDDAFEWFEQLIQVEASVNIKFPELDAEWFISKAWNMGVQCHRNQSHSESQKFMKIALTLLELGKELHKQYQELTLLETRSILAVD